MLTIYANKTATATFTPLPPDRCATPTDATCIRAVYKGAPDDYAQVQDIPADMLLTPDPDGRYHAQRGQQITVVTAAPLPASYTRFYLQQDPVEQPWPVSFSQLIPPVGTTFTFTPTTDEDGATLITFDLTAARPNPLGRPGLKPILGDVVVTTEFLLPVPPLTLALTSSRELCTANTLTELSWQIAGGQPPYTLTIDGETVDAAAESQRANCGPLLMDPLTEEPLPNQSKAFSATATDSLSVAAAASATVRLAAPLRAPRDLEYASFRGVVFTGWEYVPLDGADQSLRQGEKRNYAMSLVRWRPENVQTWTYSLDLRGGGNGPWETPGQGVHVMSVAALRVAIERETPTALHWSAPVKYAVAFAPTNVTATATHDTITVSWDRQQHGPSSFFVDLTSATGFVSRLVYTDGSSGRETVLFGSMPPSTTFEVVVGVGTGPYPPANTSVSVATNAAPAAWEAPSRGAQQLRVSATHDSITATWTHPDPDAEHRYVVYIFDIATGERLDARGTSGQSETFRRPDVPILPQRAYRIIVRHLALEEVDRAVEVTTAAGSAQDAGGSSERASVPGDPMDAIPFTARWPVRIDPVYAMTDDLYDWRGTRYHAALDIGAHSYGEARRSLLNQSRGRVYAATDGILKVFNDRFTTMELQEPSPWVLYCPDSALAFEDQFVRSMKHTDTIAGINCFYIVSPFSGRTALVFHRPGMDHAYRYVTKYAHLAEFSIPDTLLQSADAARGLDRDGDGYADPDASIRIAEGTMLGSIGHAGVAEPNPDSPIQVGLTPCSFGERCEEAFIDPHLHFEIRRFRGEGTYDWNAPPNEPVIGPDGIRILPDGPAVDGGHTYRLAVGSPTSVVMDVPVGMRIVYVGSAISSGPWGSNLYATYLDEASGGTFALDPTTGEDRAYYVPIPEGATEPPNDVILRFRSLLDSIRVQPLP